MVSTDSMKIRWNSNKLNFDNFGVEIFENFNMLFCIVLKSKIIIEVRKTSLYSVLYLVLSYSERKSEKSFKEKMLDEKVERD